MHPSGTGSAEDQLVAEARDGSLDAFNILVERYQDAVYALCRRLLGDIEAAEDATQEAFIAAYRSIGRFEGGSFRSWLFRIAANQAKDELRRRQRRPPSNRPSSYEDTETAAEPRDESQDVTAAIEQDELGRQIGDALMQITFEQRQAILLADLYGYHYGEIATIAACSLGTVKSRIARGRERLRRILAQDPELSARFERLDKQEEATK